MLTRTKKIGSTLAGGLPHILNCVPLFTERQGTTVMITNLLHDQTEIRGVVMIMSHPNQRLQLHLL